MNVRVSGDADASEGAESGVEHFPSVKVTREGRSDIDALVSVEAPVTILFNGEELVTLLCSPHNLEFLAVGFLFSEGLVNSKDDIEQVLSYKGKGIVRVTTKTSGNNTNPSMIFKRMITSGCGRGTSFYNAADKNSLKVQSELTVTAEKVFDLASRFQRLSRSYLTTHGVHSSALCSDCEVLAFNEDIGRHNAIDKTFGECLMKNIDPSGRILVTSGRVTSEILHKAAKRNVPMIVSISAPTNLGVALAVDYGITLVGSARGGKMIVYSHDRRVV
ncbi:MAG: formate dehydrogenase accessory sulfurtransferase FdhD [Dehalococcoidia bacterium]|nr:formate dehydrogenase accessory sulfurtransferase FdhD [Dehalococcoidia bacterium]